MRRIAIEGCTLTIEELVQIAEKEPVILTRNGTAVLGIAEVDDLEMEAWALGNNPDFLAMLERFRERARQEGDIPLAEVRHRFDIPSGASGTLYPGEE